MRNFIVKSEDSMVNYLSFLKSVISLLLVLLGLALILLDKLNELNTIFLQVVLRVFKSLMGGILFLLKLVNFFYDGVVSKLDQKHVLLLIDELIDILRSLFSSKLNS